jgi:argininosuccinate lyase
VLKDELYAAERANELVVKEGLPFREAYRKVAAALAKKKK